jgi:hypothetical protein
LKSNLNALGNWGYSIPLELVLSNPAADYPWLYRHAKLLDKHPVRVLIPVVPGLERAVKVAASLHFAIKLELRQVESAVAEELLETLNFYLHHAGVSQPIEFFHSTLEAFYRQQPSELWDVQGEHPAYIRYVTDDGRVTLARQPIAEARILDLESFVDDLKTEQLASRGECTSCEFFEYCGSYFKWPDKNYDCIEVKVIFATLRDAAAELGRDVEMFAHARAGVLR